MNTVEIHVFTLTESVPGAKTGSVARSVRLPCATERSFESALGALPGYR